MVNIMNENMELVKYLYKVNEMGYLSTKSLINNLKNRENKIKHVLEMELKEYEKFMKECEKILNKNSLKLNKNSIMTKMSSNLGIMVETMKDNSDSAIASMLIEGFTMGRTELESKISKYKSVCERKYINIAKKIKKFHDNEIRKLSEYI